MKGFFRKLRNKLFLNSFRGILKEEISGLKTEIFDYIHKCIKEAPLLNRDDLYRHGYELKTDLQNILINEVAFSRSECIWRIDEIREKVQKDIYTNIQRLLTIHDLHQKTFSPFKNCNNGKDVVLVGAGPSVNKFVPIENAVYVGLNRAFKLDTVKFDYLFSIDWEGIKDYAEDFFNYGDDDCIKFIGDQNLPEQMQKQIPESILHSDKIRRYMTNTPNFEYRFTKNIDSEPLNNACTVSLQAMQFVLYTNPKKIYLVGIDCSADGHFIGNGFENINEDIEELAKIAVIQYQELKQFAQVYYPNTEIISVNPVNLKGIFKDWYQDQGEC